ncbi:MAG TPA: 6-phosphogluconolactonase [Candidatus Paceibacterota bacterium]|nr:6-phosphogluconolactonase [Candidatus Paceibacterota bacterium]
MVFRHSTTLEPVVSFLARQLHMQLSMGARVLWLVPGGSGIAVAVRTAHALQAHHAPFAQLTVTLTDERYGPVGHTDSNWAMLETAGFSLPGATLMPVLTGVSRKETTRLFAKALADALEQATYRIGLFGIGADGHTAGILPGSIAAVSDELAEAYDAGTFERITITPRVIEQLSEVVAYAAGEEKWPTLATLIATGADISTQPAQALKHAVHTTLFSDYQLSST